MPVSKDGVNREGKYNRIKNINMLQELKAQLGRFEKVEIYSKPDLTGPPKYTLYNRKESFDDFQRKLENEETVGILNGYYALYVGKDGENPEKLQKILRVVKRGNPWKNTLNNLIKAQNYKGGKSDVRVQKTFIEGEARKQFGDSVNKPYSNTTLLQKGKDSVRENVSEAIFATDPETLLEIAQKGRFKKFEAVVGTEAEPARIRQMLANWVPNHLRGGGGNEEYAGYIAAEMMKLHPEMFPKGEGTGERSLTLFAKRYSKKPQADKERILVEREWNKLNKGVYAEDFMGYVRQQVIKENPDIAGYENVVRKKAIDEIKSKKGKELLEDWRRNEHPDYDADKLNKVMKSINIRGPQFEEKEIKQKVIGKSLKDKIWGAVFRYSWSGTGRTNPVKYMQKKTEGDKEIEEIFEKHVNDPEGAIDELRDYVAANKTFDYVEYVKQFGSMSKKEFTKIKSTGIKIEHEPDILPGMKESTWNIFGGGKSTRSSGGGSLKRTARTSLFGTTKTTIKDGEVKTYKEQGRMGRAFDKAGTSIKRKIAPTASDIQAKHSKKPYWTIMSENQKKNLTVSHWPSRLLQVHKAKKMYGNEGYLLAVKRKERDRADRESAKYITTEREGEMRKKASGSTFWAIYYWGTHNIKVLLAALLIIAVLFLPIGMFYVAGWALAVGAITLIMFIIWVFMEFWWFIAQGIVAVVNLISQMFVGLINGIGNAFAGWVGFHFTPMSYTLMENMKLVEIDPVTHQRRILGITWGQWNLVPPSFMRLDSFMPTKFDTDSIVAKLLPGIKSFFAWFWGPIANQYTAWIQTAPWYYIGAIVGVPLCLIILGVVLAVVYVKRRLV